MFFHFQMHVRNWYEERTRNLFEHISIFTDIYNNIRLIAFSGVWCIRRKGHHHDYEYTEMNIQDKKTNNSINIHQTRFISSATFIKDYSLCETNKFYYSENWFLGSETIWFVANRIVNLTVLPMCSKLDLNINRKLQNVLENETTMKKVVRLGTTFNNNSSEEILV